MSRSKCGEFDIVIKSLPDNWANILIALHDEGIWADEMMAHVDADSCFPIPSDGSLHIDGKDVILDGSAECGGGPGCGYCQTRYPKDDADSVMEYSIQIHQDNFDGDFIDRFQALLEKHNVQYKRSVW